MQDEIRSEIRNYFELNENETQHIKICEIQIKKFLALIYSTKGLHYIVRVSDDLSFYL